MYLIKCSGETGRSESGVGSRGSVLIEDVWDALRFAFMSVYFISCNGEAGSLGLGRGNGLSVLMEDEGL